MIRNLCRNFLIFLITLATMMPADSDAITSEGLGRQRSCSSSTGEISDGLNHSFSDGGKDAQFNMTNPVCLAIALKQYVDVKASISAMNYQCTGSANIRATPSMLLDAIDLSKSTYKCATDRNAACCALVVNAYRSFTQFLIDMYIVYEISKSVYDNTSVCGSQWMKPNPNKYDLSAADYKQEVQLKIDGYIRDQDNSSKGLSFDNQIYREWFYDGAEYEDNPYQGSVCLDPTRPKINNEYPKQRYYLKGIESGNYNCKKYLVLPGQSTPYDRDEMKEAYECCLNRSKNYMCLDYTNINITESPPALIRRTPTFCKRGENCTMMRPSYYLGTNISSSIEELNKVPSAQNGGIWFTVSSNDSENRLLCAQTYSLCPYNFYVGGGADECVYYRDGKYDSSTGIWTIITEEQVKNGECAQNSEIRNEDCTYNEKVGKCINYCQYLTHCTKTSGEDYYYQSSLGSPYFAQACLDFTGDSQNNSGYNTGVVMGKQMHFSAPIAQCIKESLENLFYNRAGHSMCLTSNESPDANGTCASGIYIKEGNFTYKKGNKVKDDSFFETIQKTMNLVVKLCLTLAVVFYGANLLILKNNLGDKKDILVFILKMALVMYFCVGTAWQDIFFRGFYDASMSLAQIIFKIETSSEIGKQDGCQFGKITYTDGSNANVSIYPNGKSYLAIWDTIDCKMMRYLGFGPQLSNANIASLIISAWFFGPIGIYFAMSVMIFGFFIIALAIRALHIFISSAAAIILLIFVSPIIIPCGLFEKTKGIFTNWLAELFSYCLQPMILFAYVAIFISVMDRTLIGSATFVGNPPNKTMSCDKVCYDIDGKIVPYDGSQAPPCDENGQKLINPIDDSVACMLNFQGFGTWKAFQVIGIALPALENLLEENVKQRILTLLKGTLIMLLLYTFMDEIPGIISSLVGGGLGGGKGDALDMFKKSVSMVKGVTNRITRSSESAARGAGSSIDNAARYYGKSDRSPSEPEEKSEAKDEVGNSGVGNNVDSVGSSNSSSSSNDEASKKTDG